MSSFISIPVEVNLFFRVFLLIFNYLYSPYRCLFMVDEFETATAVRRLVRNTLFVSSVNDNDMNGEYTDGSYGGSRPSAV